MHGLTLTWQVDREGRLIATPPGPLLKNCTLLICAILPVAPMNTVELSLVSRSNPVIVSEASALWADHVTNERLVRGADSPAAVMAQLRANTTYRLGKGDLKGRRVE